MTTSRVDERLRAETEQRVEALEVCAALEVA